MDPSGEFREKRKPVAGSTAPPDDERDPFRARPSDRRAKSVGARPRGGGGHHGPGAHSPLSPPAVPPLPPRPGQLTTRTHSGNLLPGTGGQPRLVRVASAATLDVPGRESDLFRPISPCSTSTSVPPPPYSAGPVPDRPSRSQTAFAAARDLAARLKPLPTSSTKHHTLLLHSGPLVLYRGPATSVSLTVFASAALPARRTFWLQRRGFSGDTGARLKALVGADGDWTDVTPSVRAAAADVDPAVERGWARDIGRIVGRLERAGRSAHTPRETHVIRIPAAAGDGYFRVVLCSGGGDDNKTAEKKRKVLCPGPVFRVASASTDASVFRGASLKTLPLEVGVKVASTIATSTAARAVAPLAGRVRDGVQKLQSAPAVRNATWAAGTVGLDDHLASMEERYARGREEEEIVEDQQGHQALVSDVDVVGPDEGPEAPFPLDFSGTVVQGTGRGSERLAMPTANLSVVPHEVKLRMRGRVYFGWACVLASSLPARDEKTTGAEGSRGADYRAEDGQDKNAASPDSWHAAIITAGSSPNPSVVAKTTIAVHMIYDFGDRPAFYGARVRVLTMGYLRRASMPGAEEEDDDVLLDALSQDVWLTVASLSREAWGPHAALDGIGAARAARTVSDRYVEARERVQRQVDRIPAHWAGIRTAEAEARDSVHGRGGYWISR